MLKVLSLRTWVTIGVVLLLVSSLAGWFFTRDRLPPTIRIAAGAKGGLYYDLATDIAEILEQRTGVPVEVIETHGSANNCELLDAEQADLAIVQGDTVYDESIVPLTPLFPEIVHVIVRRDSGIRRISDLADHQVALGPEGSGTRLTALKVMRHYDLAESDDPSSDDYFTELLNDPSLDAAVVTAGIDNADLKQVLKSREFDLLSLSDAKAVEMKSPFFRYFELPRGLYAEKPAVPSGNVDTLATSAFLAGREDVSKQLVNESMHVVFEGNLYLDYPTLFSRTQAVDWMPRRMQPDARRYLVPSDNIGMMANIMESLAATKELLVALSAGIYLIWARWRRLNQQEKLKRLQTQKDHLDRFLTRTLEVERAQQETTDRAKLNELLEEVTSIKLAALEELTEEELRSDQAFEIFLIQCSNLISTIQLKLIATGNVQSATAET